MEGEHTAAPGTHRLTLEARAVDREPLIARLWAAGALGIWEQPARIDAWFDDPRPQLPSELTEHGSWSFEADRDWQAEWKATIAPVRAGHTVIVPTWLAADHEPEPGEITIVLDPGRAFGSGHHATTTLCLELLGEHDLTDRSVADVGCGSGVLAIAAAMRGARAVGVDIDPSAVEVTRENAARNGVEVDVWEGSAKHLRGPADVVVANLITDVVVSLAGDLVAASRSTLIVSGIASERTQLAVDALTTAGATVSEVRERDGWVALLAAVPTHGR